MTHYKHVQIDIEARKKLTEIAKKRGINKRVLLSEIVEAWYKKNNKK